MPRTLDTQRPSFKRPAFFHQRPLSALCVGLVLSVAPIAQPFTLSFAPPFTGSSALAQQPDRATQALFLAVEKNDLPGTQAAIDGGANLEARDFQGMQPVDLAIERGYYDIAHYLISVRNQTQAQGGKAQPTPSPQELAQSQAQSQDLANPAPATPATPPAPQLSPDTPNPFDAPSAANGLPVIGDVREPAAAAAPAPQISAVQSPLAETAAPAAEASQKASASKTFVTTFFDFFKPPNTTGITRENTRVGDDGQDALTDEELSQELKKLEAELGDAPIKGPAVPISPDELARELPPAPEVPEGIASLDEALPDTPALPPYQVSRTGAATVPQIPEVSSSDAFGNLEVADVTAADAEPLTGSVPPAPQDAPLENFADSMLPFGGGVDPDILALLGMAPARPAEQVAEADPFAAPDDPFAAPADPFAAPADPFAAPDDPFAAPPQGADPGPDSVAGLLEGLGDAEEVSTVTTHKPPTSGEAGNGDPFAADPSDPFAAPPAGEVDELAGLLEGVGESVSSKQDGWDVKEVEGAALPNEMAVLADIIPTGSILDGTELALGADAVIGQPVGEERLKMMEEETIHKPCLQKGGPQTVFCVDKVSWPFELEEDFLVDTIMYQGTRAITRYDAGRASYYHALFQAKSFNKVVNYYIGRFGQPSEVVQRAIAPLAQPRRDNPTYIWRSREPGTDTTATLEIRQFDDARGGFPDTSRGVVLLYRDHTEGIFPLLSQLELMVLKDTGALDLQPKTPDSVW